MSALTKFKTKYNFEITELGDETIAVPVDEGASDFHGVVTLGNDTAVFMFKKLQEGVTVQDLINACLEEYSGSTAEEVTPKVKQFLETLNENGLLAADKT